MKRGIHDQSLAAFLRPTRRNSLLMLRAVAIPKALRNSAFMLRDSSHLLKLYLAFSVSAFLAIAAHTLPHDRFVVVVVLSFTFAGISLVKPIPHPRGGTINPNVPVILTASLLWSPGEALLGTGLGSAFGLLVFRRNEPWRVASNSTGWGLSAAASAQAAEFARAATSSDFINVVLAGTVAAIVYAGTNTIFFSMYRSIMYHRPFISESWYGLRSQGWLIRISDPPLAIAAAIIAHFAGTTSAALAATVCSALAVPVSRWYTGLYIRRTMHARARAALQKSQQHFRTLTAHISDGITLLTAEGVVLYASLSGRDVLGHPSTDVIGRSWFDLCHPGDLRRAQSLLESVLRSPGRHAVAEIRMQHEDGSWRWMQTTYANCVMEPSVQAIVVTHRDISAQKRSEETLEEYASRLRDLSRQLVQAQETERKAIARELHDEIGQILTGLRLTLDAMQQLVEGGATAPLLRAITIVDTLQDRVRTLSLNLRPMALDDRGLLPALLLQCNQCLAHGLEVNVFHSGVSGRRFPSEVETTAYRVVQEGLTNVARHAGVKAATVRLWADEETLGVQVEDDGQGFNVEPVLAATQSGGLSGMRERVTLVGGELVVESTPRSGTRITAELRINQHTTTSP
jgi:PAS domain S-box-containing protein